MIGGGLAILYTLAAQFGIDALQPARGALRQGVIFDLEERRRPPSPRERGADVREESVRDLQRRFDVDLAQAQRVTTLATRLFDAVAPDAGRGSAARTALGLRAARGRHDGLAPRPPPPQRLRARPRRRRRVLAEPAAAHRRPGRSASAADCASSRVGSTTRVFAWQTLCLRLAVIFCHARLEDDSATIVLRRQGATARLELPAGWTESHPRTLHLLRGEGEAWQRSGRIELVLRDQPS